MAQCFFCKLDGFVYREDYNGTPQLFNPNNETFHECSKNPKVIQASIDRFSKKFHEVYKFKAKIWCNICEMGFSPTAVCGHLMSAGFKEGIDGVDYFADSNRMHELRKARREAIKAEPEKTSYSL